MSLFFPICFYCVCNCLLKHLYEHLCNFVVGVFWFSFLLQMEMFLVFDMIDFLLKPGHFGYYDMSLRILFKSVFIILLLTLLWQGTGNVTSLLPGGVEIQVPYSALIDIWVGEGLLITAWHGGSSSSTLRLCRLYPGLEEQG